MCEVQELARDFQSNESLPLLLEMLREAGAELPQEDRYYDDDDYYYCYYGCYCYC